MNEKIAWKHLDGAYQLPSFISVIDHYDVDWILDQIPSKEGLYSVTPKPIVGILSGHIVHCTLKYNSQFLI